MEQETEQIEVEEAVDDTEAIETVLDETEEAAKEEVEEPVVDPKDAVIGDYRRQARDNAREAQEAREETARLKGQLDAQQAPETTEKSPLEKYVEENPGAAVDGETHLAQKKWEDDQAAKATVKATADKKVADEETAKTDRETKAQASFEAATVEFSTAKVGSGLELETVLAAGGKHVTDGEKLDINNAADKCYQVAYRMCLDAILRQTADGKPTAEAQLFKQRMKLHKQAPENKPETETDELETEKSDFDPLTQFIFGKKE